jgi:hypothetical protein
MCKKLIYPISFVLVLGLVCDVQAADVIWTDAGPDHLWSTPTNWDTGTFPTPADTAQIDMLPGPIIANEGAVEVYEVSVGDTSSGALTVDGGTLTTTEYIRVGRGAGSNGTLNMISGTITIGANLILGQKGHGTLNMAGGTITVGGTLQIARKPEATGHVNLDGGIIITNSIVMRRDIGSVGTMDVTAGTLIINGDALSNVQGFIDNGWITAYDGNGTLQLDYNVMRQRNTAVGL